MCSDLGVLEGFICPICFKDLGSLYNLTDHFELTHNSEEDKALLNQIKGLFDKAKKKFLKKDDEYGEFSDIYTKSASKSTAVSKKFKELVIFEPQEMGVTRSHTDCFKSSRERRIDRFVIETNKILIRLDKLINIDANLEPSKRKAQEKSIVSWAPDQDVNLCMTCGKSFSMIKRKHHCRLCGRIICHKCSFFLPYDFAKQLVNPSLMYHGDSFHRSSSNSSLNSTMGSEGSSRLRTCQECTFLLERRQEQVNQQTCKPTIVLLYEKVRGFMCEAEEWLPQYNKMVESLSCGETTYELQDAQNVKDKLLKCCEYITLYLKQLVSDNNGDTASQPDPTSKQHRLQQMISIHASSFIQDNLLSLSKLPTETELLRLRETRKLEAQKRIAEERRMEQERMKRLDEERQQQQQQLIQQPRQPVAGHDSSHRGHRRVKSSEGITAIYCNKSSTSPITHTSGWAPRDSRKLTNHDDDHNDDDGSYDNDPNNKVTFLPTTSRNNSTFRNNIPSQHGNLNRDVTDGSDRDDDLDPILLQIGIIKSYLEQAKEGSRWDEVRMLRDNLIDLKEEYEKMQLKKQYVK